MPIVTSQNGVLIASFPRSGVSDQKCAAVPMLKVLFLSCLQGASVLYVLNNEALFFHGFTFDFSLHQTVTLEVHLVTSIGTHGRFLCVNF